MTTTPQNTETAPNTRPLRPGPVKERSEAQIAASRANGAKSRGPKTPEGKAIAAQNALRHGCLAKLTVMKGEDEHSFMQLSANLIHAFHPTDEHECNLVETMLICMWRRNRALAMETAGMSLVVLRQAGITSPTPDPLNPIDNYSIAFRGFAANPEEKHALDLLHRYEARHTRAYERAAKSLDAYRKARQTNPSPYDLPDPESDPEPETAPDPTPESTPDRPQTEPRAQASVPNTTTQQQIQPNEPKPHPATQHRANQPARRKLKKNRRRK